MSVITGVVGGFGLAYGIVLMIGGMVFWMRLVLGVEPEKRTTAAFGASLGSGLA
jgi:hypothetical protein